MRPAYSTAGRIRVRGCGFDVTQVRCTPGRATFDVTAEPAGTLVAELAIDLGRGRPVALLTLRGPRGAHPLHPLAAPLARLLRVYARTPLRAAIRDSHGRTIARVSAATPASLARAFARFGGVSRPAPGAIPREMLERYGRERSMVRTREPSLLGHAGIDVHDRPQWLESSAAAAWRRMQRAASRDGVSLQLVSAFRSIAYQSGIVARKLARGQTLAEVLRVNAAPGYSEHHTGRALDLTTPGYPALEEAFEASPAFAWLREHARRFGFSMSYPRDNPHGIAYEPWHWRFDAKTAAPKDSA